MPETNKLLILLDGHALVHRAFHALPPLSVSKTGEMVGAVYGFASMLLKVLTEYNPSYVAVAFDLPSPTFRHLAYDAYKAQRAKAPEELRSQIRRVRELVDAFNIPVFEAEGFEADDVLGTLARQACEAGVETIIVTGDADAMQLVNPHVRVLTSRKGFTDTVLFDEEGVREKYGVAPGQIPDLKGLKGDPSDNIPGVPGIGEKTAVKLVQQFGSVEKIYENLHLVGPVKVQEALRRYEQQARRSKELGTIVVDAPVKLDLAKCHRSSYDRAKVVELFRDLEFRSLLSRLPKEESGNDPRAPDLCEMAAAEPDAPNQCYAVVDTERSLEQLASAMQEAEWVAVDVETTGLDPMRDDLVGLSVALQPGQAYYIPIGHRAAIAPSPAMPTLLQEPAAGEPVQLPLDVVLKSLKPVLEAEKPAKIAHNAKFDLNVLIRHGCGLGCLRFDTMVAAYLLNEKGVGLKDLAFGKMGVEMTPISALIGNGAKRVCMADVPITRVAEYACADADMTFRLWHLLDAELRDQGLWKLFEQVEMPLVPVLARMERNGVALDVAFLAQMSRALGEQIRELELGIYNSIGHQFNINSTQQLGKVLFEELRLPRGRRTKTGYSTDAAVLEELRGAHPVVEQILEYRQMVKLKSTYLDALPALVNPETGRLHTSFNQTNTATGRLSSSDPNLQNIPIRTELGRQVRRAFVAAGQSSNPAIPLPVDLVHPRPGEKFLLGADYSQIELRILAHITQDSRLLAAFAADEDIHAATASTVFGIPLSEVTPNMRRVAKTVNFGVIYGMSDYGLSQGTDLSRKEAGEFIANYFAQYKGIKDYLDRTKTEAFEHGYVQTLMGRRRYIPEIRALNPNVKQAAERMAVNMPIQGTAADIIKLAMIDLQQEIDRQELRSLIVLQVHDELLLEVPAEELEVMKMLVPKIMGQAYPLSVPLKVDVKVGRNWGEME